MKNTLLSLLLIVSLFSCKKEDPDSESEIKKGVITVYTEVDHQGGYIDVKIGDKEIGQIQYLAENPDCKDEYTLWAVLDYGTYKIYAVDGAGNTWDYTVVLDTDCVLFELK